MKKRRILTMLLAGILLLAGCASLSPTPTAPPGQPEEESDPYAPPIEEAPIEEPPAEEEPPVPQFTGPVTLIQSQPPEPGDTIAVMETTMGTIRIRLFPQYAPITVENFVGLIEQGFYEGIIFHRVIPNFMIQGGCPQGTGMGGMSIFLDEEGNPQPFEDEVVDELWNFRGALSMANAGPGTNMSQFFIVQSSDPIDEATAAAMREVGFPEEVIYYYSQVGGTPHLDGFPSIHTVFGHVIEGMDVVDAIAGVQTVPGDRPAEDVEIISITLETAE